MSASVTDDADRLRGDGKTVMFLSVNGAVAELLAVADRIKETTPDAIRGLDEHSQKRFCKAHLHSGRLRAECTKELRAGGSLPTSCTILTRSKQVCRLFCRAGMELGFNTGCCTSPD